MKKTVKTSRNLRRVVRFLLGEQNAKNLYGEDDSAEKFKAIADAVGGTVMSFELYLNSGQDSCLEWVIDPLAYSKEENAHEQKENVALWEKVKLDGNAGDHSAPSNNRDCVPPLIEFKRGERITHVIVIARGKSDAQKQGASSPKPGEKIVEKSEDFQSPAPNR